MSANNNINSNNNINYDNSNNNINCNNNINNINYDNCNRNIPKSMSYKIASPIPIVFLCLFLFTSIQFSIQTPVLLQVNPNEPQIGQSVQIVMTQPLGSGPVEHHVYSFYTATLTGSSLGNRVVLTPIPNMQDISVQTDEPYNLSSSFEYDCDNGVPCSGWIWVKVVAVNGSEVSSPLNTSLVRFKSSTSMIPIVYDATPQECISTLNSNGRCNAQAGQSQTMLINFSAQDSQSNAQGWEVQVGGLYMNSVSANLVLTQEVAYTSTTVFVTPYILQSGIREYGTSKSFLFSAPSSTLTTPTVTVSPSHPFEGSGFSVYAIQSDGKQVDSHSYSFYTLDQSVNPPVERPISSLQNKVISTQSPDKLNSSYTYTCGSGVPCTGSIVVKVVAKKSSQTSDEAISGVIYQKIPPKKPILIAVDPQEKFSGLYNSGCENIEINKSIKMTIESSPDAPATEILSVKTTRNGNEMVALTYEHNVTLSGPQISLNIDCKALGCKDMETFVTTITPYTSAGTSGESLQLTLTSFDPNVVSIVAPLVCNSSCIDDAIKYMGAGLVAMVLIIALVYMLGESLGIPQFLEWSKNEAVQLAIVPIIFIIILFLMNIVCTFEVGEFYKWVPSMQNCPSASGCPVTKSMTLMQASQASLYWGVAQAQMTVNMLRFDIGAMNMRATKSQYINQGIGFGANGYNTADLSGDYTSIGTLSMLLNLNTGFVITLLFQYFSLLFFSANKGFFVALIPIGLVMRSVPHLRVFGAGMVALGVGLYVVYPFILALTGMLLGPIISYDASDAYVHFYNKPPVHNSDFSSLKSAIVNIEGHENATTGSGPGSYYQGNYPQVKVTAGRDPNVASDSDYGMNVVDFAVFFRLTAQNFLRSVFIPTIGLIVTVALITNLAMVFGGEIDASKLIQMV